METVNYHLFRAYARYAALPMQVSPEGTRTYAEVARCVHGVARALAERGVRAGDRVALVAENSPRWHHAFAGILAAGAVPVPRGEETPAEDLAYILDHSEARVVFAANERAERRLPPGREVVRMDAAFPEPRDLEPGALDAYAAARRPEDIAVILYTSGTTGTPKGVVLEHRNIAHNLRVLPPLVDIRAGDVWVSVLPPWHSFEMTVQLAAFSLGCCTVYSDKRRLRDDLRAYRPHFFASVPRVWESVREGALKAIREKGPLARALFRAALFASRLRLRGNPLLLPLDLLGRKLFYGKIRAATGGRLKCAISGGGYLPLEVDEFFAAAGVRLLVGYGLTETAPVVALRRPEANVLGTIGRPVPETEVRVGPTGTLLVRGPQVMRGYYRDEALTRRVLDSSGWFDTGDLGRMTPEGDLVFVGRAKDTIVLSGGENVEPEPIENRLRQSPLIEQIMLVGQDRKTLGALVVPREEAATDPCLEERLRELFRQRTGPAAGQPPWETVARFVVLREPFTPENGLLTATLKMRRHLIAERYRDAIEGLYR